MAFRFAAHPTPSLLPVGGAKAYKEGYPKFGFVDAPGGGTRLTTPKRIAWLTEIGRLPDMVDLPYPLVSQRLRDLIERFDPGVHTFHPTTVTMLGGAIEQRYLLELGRRFDAVSAEHSNWTFNEVQKWRRPPTRESRLVLDARIIGDAHLWENDGFWGNGNPVASDALTLAAWHEGITGLLLEPYEQTDPDGNYDPPPLSRDRIYWIYEEQRFGEDGWPLPVEVRFLDGDAGRIRLADPPRGKPLLLHYAVTGKRPVDPVNVPTRALYRQTPDGMPPDLFSDAISGLPLTVSGRLRDLIERFEPGVHQFLPLSFVDGDGIVLEERHIMVPCSALEERCDERSHLGRPGRAAVAGDPRGPFVVTRGKVEGRHVWVDRIGCLYVSHEVAAAIVEHGWSGFGFHGYDLVG